MADTIIYVCPSCKGTDVFYPTHPPRGQMAQWLSCGDCGSIWLPGMKPGYPAVMAFLINANEQGVPQGFDKVFKDNYHSLLA